MKQTAWWIVVMAFLLGIVPVGAQDSATTVIFVSQGDIWSWSPQSGSPPVQRTHWGYNGVPHMSPDGVRIAYFSLPQIFIDAIPLNPEPMGIRVPQNIWMLDIATNQALRIASQPDNVRMADDGVIYNGVERQNLTWSPDGTRIAWLEAPMEESTYSVFVYDLATGTTAAPITGLDAMQCVEGSNPRLDLLFGRETLILYGDVCTLNYYVYDYEGHLLNTITVTPDDRLEYVDFLVDHDGQDLLAAYGPEFEWHFVDPLTGEDLGTSGRPERYALLAPDTSIRLVTEPGPDRGINPRQWTVQAFAPDGNELGVFPPGDFNWIQVLAALSPDGQSLITRFAYSKKHTTLWQEGQSTEILAGIDIDRLIWGPMGWRIGPLDSSSEG